MPQARRTTRSRILSSGIAVLALATLQLILGTGRATAELEPDEAASALTDQVILLHGLARNPRAMRPLERRLEAEGFRVRNLGYPSRSATPKELVAHLDTSVADCCTDPGVPLHFVTHSLGGILVRAYLAEHRPVELGRVVMLAPPNHGTELVDEFGDDWWFEPILGPTARQLGTGPGSFPNRMPPPDYALGVIAATHPLSSRLGRWLLQGQNDGVVTVESARVEGMHDFLLVETGHVRIRDDDQVADETVHFLRHGRFAAGEQRDAGSAEQEEDALPVRDGGSEVPTPEESQTPQDPGEAEKAANDQGRPFADPSAVDAPSTQAP